MNRKFAIVTSLAIAIVFVIAIPLFVKSATLTPNLGMSLPQLGETGWGPMLNTNTSTLDALYGASSGHEHTGVAGEGPKINLTTAVTGVLPAANGGVTTLTTGSIPFSNGSILTQDNANLFWDDTNNRLGLGVTTPATILEAVTSTAAERIITGTYGAADTSGFILRFRKNRSGAIVQNGDLLGEIFWDGLQSAASYITAANISAAIDGTPGAVNDMPSRLVFYTTPDGSGTATERVRIENNGEVGIGTTAPDHLLHIEKNIADQQLYLSSVGPSLKFGNNSTSSSATKIGIVALATVNGHYSGSAIAGDMYVGTYGSASPGKLHLIAGAAGAGERVTVDTDGDLGVGTISPGAKLTVSSGTNNGLSVTDGTVTGVVYSSSGPQMTVGTTSNHKLALFTNNSEKMGITAAGIVSTSATNTTSAGAGDIVIPNSTGELRGTNAAGTDTVSLISLNSSNLVSIGQHVFIRKASSESVVSSIVPQNDDDFSFSVGINETWTLEIAMEVTIANNAGFRWAMIGPSGTGGWVVCNSKVNVSIAPSHKHLISGAEATLATPTSSDVIICYGSIVVGATAGTMNFQWANSTSANGTTVFGGSWLQARRIN